jgi:hypothetical protein
VLSTVLLPRPEHQQLRALFVERWARNNPGGYLRALRALIGWSVSARLGTIRCPTLILTADQDYTPLAYKQFYTAAIPGALRARFGASEVIVTIMLNFVILAFLNYMIAEKVHVEETLHTPPINTGNVPRLAESITAFHGSAANWTILIAVAAALALTWYLFRTRGGYELRAVGLQPDAAEYGGVSVPRSSAGIERISVSNSVCAVLPRQRRVKVSDISAGISRAPSPSRARPWQCAHVRPYSRSPRSAWTSV